jgi:hypothetical protein
MLQARSTGKLGYERQRLKLDQIAYCSFIGRHSLEQRGRQQTIPAHIDFASTAAMHTPLPLWVKSGQTIAGQNPPLSAVTPIADKISAPRRAREARPPARTLSLPRREPCCLCLPSQAGQVRHKIALHTARIMTIVRSVSADRRQKCQQNQSCG